MVKQNKKHLRFDKPFWICQTIDTIVSDFDILASIAKSLSASCTLYVNLRYVKNEAAIMAIIVKRTMHRDSYPQIRIR